MSKLENLQFQYFFEKIDILLYHLYSYMTYRNKKILRLIQKKLTYIYEKIYFKTSHITPGGKVTLVGIILCFISLFMPWISTLGNLSTNTTSNFWTASSFSGLIWNVGFFILFALIVVSFWVFSIEKKEKLHFLSLMRFNDRVSALIGSIFIFIMSLHSFLLISWLQYFSMNILYGQWIILCITWSIIIWIWAYIMKNEYRKNIKGSYISELRPWAHSEQQEEEKNNMKLPF